MLEKFLSKSAVVVFLSVASASLSATTVKNVKSGDYNIYATNTWGITAFSASDDYEARQVSGQNNWLELGNGAVNVSTNFAGKSFRLYTRLHYYGDTAEVTYTFPNDGLYLYNGANLRQRLTTSRNGTAHFAGTKMEIEAGKRVYFRHVKTAPYTSTLYVDMPIISKNTSSRIQLATDGSSFTGALRFCPTVSMSDFYGAIEVVGDISNRVVALSSPVLTASVWVTSAGGVEQGDTAAYINNTVTLNSDKSFILLTTNGTFTIKKLTVTNSAHIIYRPMGTGRAMRNPGVFVIPSDGSVRADEPIKLNVNRQALMFSGQTIGTLTNIVPLVRYDGSVSGTLKLSDYLLDVDDTVESEFGALPGTFELKMGTVDGKQTVYVQVPATPIVKVNTDADSGSSTGDGHRGSALSNGMGQYKWSDGLDQHSGANYVVGPYNGTNMSLIVCDGGHSESGHFVGESLTVAYGSRMSHLGAADVKDFYAENLTLQGGSRLLCYNDGDTFSGGPINLAPCAKSSTVYFHPILSVRSTFKGGLAGEANLHILHWITETNYAHDATLCIATTSPSFTGRIELLLPDKFTDQREGQHPFKLTLEVPYALCLGGPRASFAADALLLSGNQTLSVTETTSFDDQTRGMKFKTDVQGVPAYLKIADDKTVTITEPLALCGEVCKTGGGTLALGGATPVTFFGEEGAPTESSNRFTIASGSLMPLSTNALNGCEITFKAGTRLALKADTDDAALRRYGLYDVAWEKPIVLDGTEVIDVDFEADAGYTLPANNERIALCTVPLDYTGLSVDSFRIGPLGERRGFVVAESDMVAGTRTFYADFSESGMAIVVR